MADVITYWFNLIAVIVSEMFSYPVIGDVTFGWFLLAFLVMELCLYVIFKRMI